MVPPTTESKPFYIYKSKKFFRKRKGNKTKDVSKPFPKKTYHKERNSIESINQMRDLFGKNYV